MRSAPPVANRNTILYNLEIVCEQPCMGNVAFRGRIISNLLIIMFTILLIMFARYSQCNVIYYLLVCIVNLPCASENSV